MHSPGERFRDKQQHASMRTTYECTLANGSGTSNSMPQVCTRTSLSLRRAQQVPHCPSCALVSAQCIHIVRPLRRACFPKGQRPVANELSSACLCNGTAPTKGSAYQLVADQVDQLVAYQLPAYQVVASLRYQYVYVRVLPRRGEQRCSRSCGTFLAAHTLHLSAMWLDTDSRVTFIDASYCRPFHHLHSLPPF